MDTNGSGGRLLAAFLAVAGSAALFFFGTGMDPIPALAWVAPLPVLLLAPRAGAGAAFFAALLAYLIGSANSWSYLLHSLSIPVPMSFLIPVGSAVLFALATILLRGLVRRGRTLLAALGAPALWTLALYLTSLASPVGIMGTLATTQADHPATLQIASVTGAWGVEFLVLLVPCAIAAVLAPGVSTPVRLRAVVITGAVCAIAFGYGAYRLSTADNSAQQRVAMIARSEPHWGADVSTPAGRRVLESYVDSLAALPDGVRVAVLPEAGFAADERGLRTLTGPISRIANARDMHIVVGLLSTANGKTFNSALDITPGNQQIAYHKWHNGVAGNVQSGHELAFLPGTRIGVEICMDVNLPHPSRDYAMAGANLVVLPASDENVDGWQHSRTALLRGVENGFGVAWSATRGTLMAGDAWGRVHGNADTRTQQPFATVVSELPAGTGATFYARHGDWFPVLCGMIALLSLIGAGIRRSPSAPPVDRRHEHALPAAVGVR